MRQILPVLVCLLELLSFNCGYANPQENRDDNVEAADVAAATRQQASLVNIRLPIDSRSAADTRRALQQIVDGTEGMVSSEARPIVVLEFDVSRGATGQGSAFGACLDLARFLSSKEMNRIQAVAYVPARRINKPGGGESQGGKLNGHAVLVALAADQLEMHSEVAIGAAGIDENNVDGFISGAYQSIVASRLTVPVPVAISMLDRNQALYQVESPEGFVFVNNVGLQEREASGKADSAITITADGQFTELSGSKLKELGLIRQVSDSRAQLAERLGLSVDALKSTSYDERPWRAVRIQLPKFVDKTTLQWMARALEPKVGKDKFNLIIIEFDSVGGDEDACLLLARRLVDYDPDEVRTVAFVNKEAAGPAAMLALSCDHVIMINESKLGGAFEPPIAEAKLDDLKAASAGIANELGKDPALLQAMLDPSMEVIRFRDKTTGKEHLYTQAQRDDLPDSQNWLPLGPQTVIDPISATAAEKQGIARQIVSSIDELKSFYQLDDEPEVLAPTEVDRWLHRAALFLASPFVAPWLLFLAMFFLFNEMSQPGLGVPGFLGTVCLILYFWSQHLDGNADWLEIMLFVAGVIFVLIELFVVPGFGVFGIGGLLMVVVSIVLAAQTFVFPTNTEEFNQLPKSLFALLGAIGGLGAAMVLVGAVLPRTPMFRRLMLEPPTRSEDDFPDGRDPEAIVNWSYLVGSKGVAITNLAPSGKARLDGQLIDVMSDGRLIEKEQMIEVVEVAGNRVVVVPAEP